MSHIQAATENKILIIGPSWVGDMIMAQSLFKRLRQQDPNCWISVMAPAWTLPLVERMPEVDEGIDMPIGHNQLALWRRFRLGKRLAGSGFTRAIVLPNSFKSALVPWHAGIPRRTGWHGEHRRVLLNDCRDLDSASYPLMVQRFQALADEPRLPPAEPLWPELRIDPQSTRQALGQLGLSTDGKILALCPGAEFGAAKQWPAAHYAELATEFVSLGWQVWLFGSVNDQPIATSILDKVTAEHSKHISNLVGRTSLAQAIDLMSVVTVVVSNDSGLMHVAAALQVSVVGLYGSTSPDFTPPLAERVKLLMTQIECRPCFQRSCPFGHLRCLTELEPLRVMKAIHELDEQ